MNKTEWSAIEVRLARARTAGEDLVRGVDKPWIDPLAVAAEECRFLKCIGEDFGEDFDGQLEYHRGKNLFLMFYNTRYDRLADENHHPRTRFSIAHELGHYFLEHHRSHLLRGGRAQPSKSEFASSVLMEREADAFAAGLLMPSRLMSPLVNEFALSLDRIHELAGMFESSLVSTAIRATQLSHYPTAVAGIRDSGVAWQFQSECLAEVGCYPVEKGPAKSASACEAWKQFARGDAVRNTGTTYGRDWFRTYDKGTLDYLPVNEEFLPVPSMGTLVVVMSIPEEELYPENDD